MKKAFSVYNGLLFLFIVFIAVPVLYTFFSAVFVNDDFATDVSLLSSDSFLLLAKSVLIAGIIALFSGIIGTSLAFILYKTHLRYRNIFKIILLTPLFISPYILAVAWKDFFFSAFGNVQMISSYFGVILVLTTVYTPLSMLIAGSALVNIGSHLEESALMFTDRKHMMTKIILPLIKPALLSSFVLIFIFSISNFAVPAFFGVKVFTTEIFTQFSAFYKHSFAIIQSVFLVVICVLLLISERRYIADAPFFSMGSRGTSIRLYGDKKQNIQRYSILIFWMVFSIVIPLIALFLQSFASGTKYFAKAWDLLLPTFAGSFLLAFIASVIVVVIGFVIACRGAWLNKKTNIFSWILLIIFTIPSTVFGISLIKFYNQPILNFIYSGYTILIIAYVGKFSFISAKILSNAIQQLPKSLHEATEIQGVNQIQGIFKILIPLIFPALFVSFIISFIFTLGELGTTIMVYPPGTEIMPVKVFTIMANAPRALTSSMNLIVFSLILMLITAFSFLANLFYNKSYYVDNRT